VFDLDGVVVDSEQVWDVVREQLTRDWGGRYDAAAQRAMMGMSSTEWSRYMHDELGLAQSPQEINDEVVRRMLATYEKELPLLPGAVEAIGRLRDAGLVLAVASSSNRALIDAVLRAAGVTELFATTVSSEEVARGKPSPDVYLEAARRLGLDPARCAAVEDSASGIRSAHAAGMHVLAFPNRHYPPPPEVLALADAVLPSLDALDAGLVQESSRARGIQSGHG
jgi:HAD superfamily hydrolase (TIGR01509 family)